MEKRTKQILLFITFGVMLFAMLMNLELVVKGLSSLMVLLLPVLIGLLLAFVLSVPMNGLEKLIARLFRKARHQPGQKLRSSLSLLLTMLCIVLVVVLAVKMTVPELVSSVKSVGALLKEKTPQLLAVLREYDIDISNISTQLETVNWEQLLQKLTSGAGSLLSSVLSATATTISWLTTMAFAIIIAVYVLLSKYDLARQSKKLLYARLKPQRADRICYIAIRIRDCYAKFISGQCVEAIILGLLIFVAFSICGLPYASLIAVLTAIFAFIPYIGAFASCVIGVLLCLVVNPMQGLICLIVYLCVQFVETQFIYPHVVGNSVGLSPLWTLVAALVGGKLFGLLGMIFFIPLTAAIYSLLREDTNERLKKKQLAQDWEAGDKSV